MGNRRNAPLCREHCGGGHPEAIRMTDGHSADKIVNGIGAPRGQSGIESTNFMIKKAAGPSVSARIPASRERQALLKAVVFNVLRVIKLGRVGGFQ